MKKKVFFAYFGLILNMGMLAFIIFLVGVLYLEGDSIDRLFGGTILIIFGGPFLQDFDPEVRRLVGVIRESRSCGKVEVLEFISEAEIAIQKIETAPNKIYGLLHLFRFTSYWQDEGRINQLILAASKIKGKEKPQMMEALQSIAKLVEAAGRDKDGINRTEPGQDVDFENIYLGGVFGIWTHSAKYWLEREAEFTLQENPSAPLKAGGLASIWDCIEDYKAGGFLRSHVKNLNNQLKSLQEALSPQAAVA